MIFVSSSNDVDTICFFLMQDHYVYCHEVLADYVEAFDPYANFKNL